MPLYEHQPVEVTLTIEVDGHTLRFEDAHTARGARYHGTDPRANGYATSDSLESSIREHAVDAVAKLSADAASAMVRLYPVCTDQGVKA